jgi:hypothetical protein
MCRAVRPSSDGRSSCGPRSSSIVSIRQLAHATPPGSKSPCAAPRRFVASANCFRSRWPSAARGARGSCRPTSRASRRVGGPSPPHGPQRRRSRRPHVSFGVKASPLSRGQARAALLGRPSEGCGGAARSRPGARFCESPRLRQEARRTGPAGRFRSGAVVSLFPVHALSEFHARANTRSRRTWQLIAGLSSPHITASGVQPLAAVVVWSARRPVASPLPPH